MNLIFNYFLYNKIFTQMKKNFKFMLVALLAVFGFGNAMAAPLLNTTQYGDNGLQYKILSIKTATNDFTVSVSANVYETKGAAALTIPATVKINVKGEDEASVAVDQEIEFKVVNIAENAFKGITKITSLTIEGDNLKSIEKSAFENCTGLVSATFNGGLETIKAKAFKGCSKLVTVTFPESTLADGTWLGISGAVFEGTAIKDLDLSKTKMFNVWKMFEYNNVKLQTVKMSKTVRNLKADAFADCIQLESVSFDGCSQLQTLEAGSLSNTIVSEYDFSDCYTLNTGGTAYTSSLDFTAGVNPFVNATTTTNKNLETVILPKAATLATSPVTEIGTVFANCEVLNKITNLNVSSITAVADGAFEKDINLTSLEFPTSLTAVTGSPFKGCVKLAELTFNNAGTALTIGDAANNIFGTTLDALTTLKVVAPATNPLTTANVSIAANALTGCTNITTLEFAKDGIFSGNIATFALKETEDATITFGKIAAGTTIATITGPTGTKTTALTIGDYAMTATAAIVDGIVSKATVGAIIDGSILDAIGQAKELEVTGAITTIAAPTAPNAVLTTINFNAVTIPANAIVAGAFDETNAPALTDVTWTPADANATHAFAQDAFGGSSVGASAKVTLHTTTKVATDAGINYLKLEANLYNIIFDAGDPTPTKNTVIVTGNASATYYYGKESFAVNTKIAKETEAGEQVTVYSAFVDASDNKIYMDPLAIENGYYVVAANQPVVIRMKDPSAPVDMDDTDQGYVEGGKKVEVEVIADPGATPTMRYKSGGGIVNDLKISTILFSSDYIGTNFVGRTLYAMKNPAKVGALDWGKVNKKSYLPANALFVECDESIAAARLVTVWLDGTENTTAIQNIIDKKGAQNGTGVIYNLAGQKVDANYKGIIIKNGKKYFNK